jgi:hypothetical protein
LGNAVGCLQAVVKATWLQARTADLLGVELLAQALDVGVKVMLIENLIQSRVERMRSAPRQILCRHPHRRLLRVRFRLPIAIGDSVVRGIIVSIVSVRLQDGPERCGGCR